MFTLIFMTSLMISLSSAMLLSINPLSLGIAILSTALLLTLIYSLMLTSWVSFLIFLIYIGGMLVMFAYFVALTPNQQTTPMMYIPMSITMFMSILTMLMMHITPSSLSMKNLYMNSFYLEKNIQLLLMLALILLFTMVVVVKLVTNNKGPLRPFMNYV